MEKDFAVGAWQNKGKEHFASRGRECGTPRCYGIWAPKWQERGQPRGPWCHDKECGFIDAQPLEELSWKVSLGHGGGVVLEEARPEAITISCMGS